MDQFESIIERMPPEIKAEMLVRLMQGLPAGTLRKAVAILEKAPSPGDELVHVANLNEEGMAIIREHETVRNEMDALRARVSLLASKDDYLAHKLAEHIANHHGKLKWVLNEETGALALSRREANDKNLDFSEIIWGD